MKFRFALLCLSLLTSSIYAGINDEDLDQMEELGQQVLTTKHLAPYEAQILKQIQDAKPHMQELYLADHISYNESVYIHNYAIINSQYAEYLLDQNCTEQSHPYQTQAEAAYLRLLKRDPQDKVALNNLGLFYAQMSVFYRKNTDPTPRLQYLEKSEKQFIQLIKIYPNNAEYQTNYYAVLSDKLALLQKHYQNLAEQKRLIAILKKPLFQYLDMPKQTLNAGNFIILAQQYFKDLYSENPEKAEKWLYDHQKKIEAIVKNNQTHDQRESEFLAEFYALLGQTDKALHYLKQLEFTDENGIEPSSIEDEPNLANLRLNPEYQKWFKQYQNSYTQYRKAIPQVCKITRLETT